ncbi:MAG: DDE-type integrase/transposase/recombinase, partial [Gemmatimonadaceae bacterium]|nr:DDE-type integrase/transposase/recombinase [Gemmatimonadaceae bacterium]
MAGADLSLLSLQRDRGAIFSSAVNGAGEAMETRPPLVCPATVTCGGVRGETAPGQQAQFDFATVKLPSGVRYALDMVLGFSRLLYVEFVLRQTALSVMLGMERAFAAFGGMPRHVLVDQMKRVTSMIRAWTADASSRMGSARRCSRSRR